MPYKDYEKDKRLRRERYANDKEFREHKKARDKKSRLIRKAKRVEWYKKYKKTLVCLRCGETHIATLSFHHLDKTEKEMSIKSLVYGCYPVKRIIEEMNKCIVLCENCHRKLQWEERNGREILWW